MCSLTGTLIAGANRHGYSYLVSGGAYYERASCRVLDREHDHEQNPGKRTDVETGLGEVDGAVAVFE